MSSYNDPHLQIDDSVYTPEIRKKVSKMIGNIGRYEFNFNDPSKAKFSQDKDNNIMCTNDNGSLRWVWNPNRDILIQHDTQADCSFKEFDVYKGLQKFDYLPKEQEIEIKTDNLPTLVHRTEDGNMLINNLDTPSMQENIKLLRNGDSFEIGPNSDIVISKKGGKIFLTNFGTDTAITERTEMQSREQQQKKELLNNKFAIIRHKLAEKIDHTLGTNLTEKKLPKSLKKLEKTVSDKLLGKTRE